MKYYNVIGCLPFIISVKTMYILWWCMLQSVLAIKCPVDFWYFDHYNQCITTSDIIQVASLLILVSVYHIQHITISDHSTTNTDGNMFRLLLTCLVSKTLLSKIIKDKPDHSNLLLQLLLSDSQKSYKKYLWTKLPLCESLNL